VTFVYLIYVCFAFPYFDHGAFTHHAIHVLDASAYRRKKIGVSK